MIHVEGSLRNSFCAWIAITQNFEEKSQKNRTGAQIQNFLLYSRTEARIFQTSAVEPTRLPRNWQRSLTNAVALSTRCIEWRVWRDELRGKEIEHENMTENKVDVAEPVQKTTTLKRMNEYEKVR